MSETHLKLWCLYKSATIFSRPSVLWVTNKTIPASAEKYQNRSEYGPLLEKCLESPRTGRGCFSTFSTPTYTDSRRRSGLWHHRAPCCHKNAEKEDFFLSSWTCHELGGNMLMMISYNLWSNFWMHVFYLSAYL